MFENYYKLLETFFFSLALVFGKLTVWLFTFTSHLVFETSQEINDVPYGDYFRVEVLCYSNVYCLNLFIVVPAIIVLNLK